jgi:hypothetical protein
MTPSNSTPELDLYEENQAQLDAVRIEALKIVTVEELLEREVMTLDTLWFSLFANCPDGILPTDSTVERCLTKLLPSLSVEECIDMHFVDEDDVIEYYVNHYLCKL